VANQPTVKLSSKIEIDLATLPGTLSSMLVNPENMRHLADMGLAFAQFIGRDIPAVAFTSHLKGFLKAIADSQQRAEENQRAVDDALAASKTATVTPTDRDTDAAERESSGQGAETSPPDSGA